MQIPGWWKFWSGESYDHIFLTNEFFQVQREAFVLKLLLEHGSSNKLLQKHLIAPEESSFDSCYSVRNWRKLSSFVIKANLTIWLIIHRIGLFDWKGSFAREMESKCWVFHFCLIRQRWIWPIVYSIDHHIKCKSFRRSSKKRYETDICDVGVGEWEMRRIYCA